MNHINDSVNLDFNSACTRIYFSMYEYFEKTVKKIDRKKDENVFMQLQGKYVNELEKQLGDEVKKTVERYNINKNIGALHHELTNRVAYYIREFLTRAKSI